MRRRINRIILATPTVKTANPNGRMLVEKEEEYSHQGLEEGATDMTFEQQYTV